MCNESANWRRVSGVTLLELILVMAVVIMIAAIALPAVYGSFDRQMLRKAAEQVRVDIAKTRNEAMRSGRIMVLQYAPGSRDYVVRPWAQESDLVEGDLSTMATLGSSTSGNTMVPSNSVQPGMPLGTGAATGQKTRQLPEKVTFAGGSIEQDMRIQTVDPSFANSMTTNVPVPPIVFYPDGTTSNGQIVIRNERNHIVAIQIRGLTGSTRLVEPLPDGTLPPPPGTPTSTFGGVVP